MPNPRAEPCKYLHCSQRGECIVQDSRAVVKATGLSASRSHEVGEHQEVRCRTTHTPLLTLQYHTPAKPRLQTWCSLVLELRSSRIPAEPEPSPPPASSSQHIPHWQHGPQHSLVCAASLHPFPRITVLRHIPEQTCSLLSFACLRPSQWQH